MNITTVCNILNDIYKINTTKNIGLQAKNSIHKGQEIPSSDNLSFMEVALQEKKIYVQLETVMF